MRENWGRVWKIDSWIDTSPLFSLLRGKEEEARVGTRKGGKATRAQLNNNLDDDFSVQISIYKKSLHIN